MRVKFLPSSIIFLTSFIPSPTPHFIKLSRFCGITFVYSNIICIFANELYITINMKQIISKGYTYWKFDGVAKVIDKSFSESLMFLVNISPCNIITKMEDVLMGDEELANWSTPDDKHVCIDGNILPCCKANDIKS